MPPRSSCEGGGLGADPVPIAAQSPSAHRISSAAISLSLFIAPLNYPMFGRQPGHSRKIPPRLTGQRRRAHITNMAKLHPHTEATYKIVPLVDGTFGVDVVVPDTHPTHIRGFATEAEAEAWIAAHQLHVQLNPPYRRPRPGAASP
jgi:hypothetical protein